MSKVLTTKLLLLPRDFTKLATVVQNCQTFQQVSIAKPFNVILQNLQQLFTIAKPFNTLFHSFLLSIAQQLISKRVSCLAQNSLYCKLSDFQNDSRLNRFHAPITVFSQAREIFSELCHFVVTMVCLLLAVETN